MLHIGFFFSFSCFIYLDFTLLIVNSWHIPKFSLTFRGSCSCEWKHIFLIIPAPHGCNIKSVFFPTFYWFVYISCVLPATKNLNQVCACDVTISGQCLAGPSINDSYSYPMGFSSFIVYCNKTWRDVPIEIQQIFLHSSYYIVKNKFSLSLSITLTHRNVHYKQKPVRVREVRTTDLLISGRHALPTMSHGRVEREEVRNLSFDCKHRCFQPEQVFLIQIDHTRTHRGSVFDGFN